MTSSCRLVDAQWPLYWIVLTLYRTIHSHSLNTESRLEAPGGERMLPEQWHRLLKWSLYMSHHHERFYMVRSRHLKGSRRERHGVALKAAHMSFPPVCKQINLSATGPNILCSMECATCLRAAKITGLFKRNSCLGWSAHLRRATCDNLAANIWHSWHSEAQKEPSTTNQAPANTGNQIRCTPK